MDNLTPIFIALTGAAVVLQAGVLVAMYLSIRKTSASMEAMAAELRAKVLPTIDTVNAMVVDLRPKVQSIADNLQETTNTLRGQVQRVDAAVNDVVDRARLQVIRADELLNRTLDRVEETSDMVHKTVISPVRQVSGIMQGLTASLEFLMGGRTRRSANGSGATRAVPQDEMFI
jgi:chromatin segregation and condensation protein Rec8/ScpA/Scc1 (kleisin family)